jgi:hypothetical protein
MSTTPTPGPNTLGKRTPIQSTQELQNSDSTQNKNIQISFRLLDLIVESMSGMLFDDIK